MNIGQKRITFFELLNIDKGIGENDTPSKLSDDSLQQDDAMRGGYAGDCREIESRARGVRGFSLPGGAFNEARYAVLADCW